MEYPSTFGQRTQRQRILPTTRREATIGLVSATPFLLSKCVSITLVPFKNPACFSQETAIPRVRVRVYFHCNAIRPFLACACHTYRMRQVVVAISGFYVGLYVVCKGISALFSSPKKKEVGEKSRQEGVLHTSSRVYPPVGTSPSCDKQASGLRQSNFFSGEYLVPRCVDAVAKDGKAGGPRVCTRGVYPFLARSATSIGTWLCIFTFARRDD